MTEQSKKGKLYTLFHLSEIAKFELIREMVKDRSDVFEMATVTLDAMTAAQETNRVLRGILNL